MQIKMNKMSDVFMQAGETGECNFFFVLCETWTKKVNKCVIKRPLDAWWHFGDQGFKKRLEN